LVVFIDCYTFGSSGSGELQNAPLDAKTKKIAQLSAKTT
jgi:hypothetical protein